MLPHKRGSSAPLQTTMATPPIRALRQSETRTVLKVALEDSAEPATTLAVHWTCATEVPYRLEGVVVKELGCGSLSSALMFAVLP